MGEIFQSGEFWLPPEFFTGDGILADEPKPTSSLEIDFPAKKGRHSSYSSSYSLSSSAFSSPVESVLGSMETDSDEEEETGGACYWDVLSCADVATKEGKTMRMNGVDEGVYKGMRHVAHQCGPTVGINRFPLGNNHCASFYANQFPINQVEPNNQRQITHQNKGYILGRPSIDLLYQRIQLQQQLISQHRSKVLYTNQFNENFYGMYSSLGLPYLAKSYPFGVHQMNKMSTGDSLGIFGQKQTSIGTGVFIPRPNPPVAGHCIARNPPRFFQVVNKSAPLITTQLSNAPHHDTSVIVSSAIPTQKDSGSQLHSYVKHEQCLPQEWSY